MDMPKKVYIVNEGSTKKGFEWFEENLAEKCAAEKY